MRPFRFCGRRFDYREASVLHILRPTREMAALGKDSRAQRILEQLDGLDRAAGRQRVPTEAK